MSDIRQLRYFVAAVECESLTRAAERLSVAQPALGVAIRKLEEEFGIPLLVRHSRGIVPTEAGRELLHRARALIADFDAMQDAMRARGPQEEPSGRVALGLTPSIANLLGAALLSRAMAVLPRLRVAIVEARSETLVERVADGSCDLALLRDLPERHRAVRGEPLAREPMHLIERGPAAGGAPRPGGTVRLGELSGRPIALPGLMHEVLPRRLMEAARAAGCELQVACEVPALGMLRPLLMEGHCVSILPAGAFLSELRAGELTASRLVEPDIERVISLAYTSARSLTRAEHALRALIREEIGVRASADPAPWRIA